MANLKIQDKNGNWFEIPAIKGSIGPQGPKGDTGLQGATGPQGPKGDTGATGKSLEYDWDGTKLGIRQEGQSSYEYVELSQGGGITNIETISDAEIESICIFEI